MQALFINSIEDYGFMVCFYPIVSESKKSLAHCAVRSL